MFVSTQRQSLLLVDESTGQKSFAIQHLTDRIRRVLHQTRLYPVFAPPLENITMRSVPVEYVKALHAQPTMIFDIRLQQIMKTSVCVWPKARIYACIFQVDGGHVKVR
jgi:hypothetical protein